MMKEDEPISTQANDPELDMENIIGLGSFSARKTYYPELQKKIKEQKALNDELSRQNEQINQTNEELAQINKQLEQTNADLKAALKKAEESDRLKSAFLANVSHEIRTPMNGIMGFAQLLRDRSYSEEEQHKYIGIIEKSGERMLNTINDLISIAKIEAEQTDIILEEVNLMEMAQEAFVFFKEEARAKGLYFNMTSNIAPAGELLISDKNKLFAILSNLLKNAIKYTQKGGVELKIYKSSGDIALAVCDTGIGIPKEKHAAVFDRFVQASLSISQPYEGAGLGLSIAKAYAEMLGGRIHLKSEIGKGSEFTLLIPAPANFSTEDAENEEKTTAGRQGGSVSLSDCSVLVVEDDVHSRLYISTILEGQCRQLHYALNGQQALEKLRDNNVKIDLILMDLKMPEMDGFEASRKIRAIDPDVKIIAQTAYAMEGDQQKALKAGCNDYISKPFKKNDLLLKMKSVFA